MYLKVCGWCGELIDSNICWCGVPESSHNEPHMFVPMGCCCHAKMKEVTENVSDELTDADKE